MDGLRGAAVLAAILFHTSLGVATGRFAGQAMHYDDDRPSLDGTRRFVETEPARGVLDLEPRRVASTQIDKSGLPSGGGLAKAWTSQGA